MQRTTMRTSLLELNRQQAPATDPEEPDTLPMTTQARDWTIASAGGIGLYHCSAEIARRYLASHGEAISEQSQLFEDLRQFALSYLSTARVSRT